MIIRSQDKKAITTDLNVRIHENDYIHTYEIFNDAVETLGEYSTEEKAIKVLDMIQETYGKHYYGQGGQMATVDYYVPPFAFIPPKVFQMPQDSEVQHEKIYR